MPRKRIKLVLTIVTFGFIVAWQEAKAAECKISVGWEEWPPFMIKTPAAMAGQGTKSQDSGDYVISGFDHDMLTEAAKRANCAVEWVEMPWARLLNEIAAGSMDAAMNAAHTPDREDYGYYTPMYFQPPIALWFRKGEVARRDAKSPQDFKNTQLTFGLWRDAIMNQDMLDMVKSGAVGKPPIYLNTTKDFFAMLQGKRIDVFLLDLWNGQNYAKQNKIVDQVEHHPMLMPGAGSHFLFSKKSVKPEVVERFSKAVEAMKSEGLPDKVIKTYLEKGW